MNTYANISNELKTCFKSSSFFRKLLPIDFILLFAALAIMVLDQIFKVHFGIFINALVFWAFIFGLILTYANMRQQFLFIGLLVYFALRIISLISWFKYGFDWYSFFYALVFGGLAYLVFKNSSEETIKTNYNG